MALAPGVRLGPYQVIAQIGAGGMGEVYRATDTSLQRAVAVKVLPDAFAQDADRLARFEREAQLLATLNHPNIAQIYGMESGPAAFDSAQAGEAGRHVRALVMELVEGPTLADRIARGPIPIDEALRIARQVAEALDAAHERGIIHRDLKPANIKVRSDGTVKVLDFGLAKLTEASGPGHPGPDLSASPTILVPAMTHAGVILGTAAYMSPEQARGQAVDRRTDVFAFGCVLYEMLTGRRSFEGNSASDTLASVLRSDPDWSLLPAGTPDGIRRLLDRCLRKERERRLKDLGDARLEIDEAQPGAQPSAVHAAPRGNDRARRTTSVAAIAAIVIVAIAVGWWAAGTSAPAPEVRLEIAIPAAENLSFAVSPDGTRVAFAATINGERRLWLRALDAPEARPLAGTERAAAPFWSPDSRAIGFFSDTALKTVSITGGTPTVLAPATTAAGGGAWNDEGTILYSASPGTPILRISAAGGEAVAATRFEPTLRSHSAPLFLPDGRHFLYFVDGPPDRRGVHLGQLDSLDDQRLVDAETPAVYTSAGYLVFVRDGTLLAQAFDAGRLALRGDPFVIAQGVTPATRLSAAAAGPLVYYTPPTDTGQRQLLWVDRAGTELNRVTYPDTAGTGPAMSADGRRIAVFRFANGNMDIWSYDTVRRAWERLTSDPGDDISPLWSWDGTRLAFGSRRGSMDLFWTRLGDPLGNEERLLTTPQPKFLNDWSRDGRFLLYNTIDPRTGTDIWALPLDGERTPVEMVRTAANEQNAQFSPDGRWVAYQSDRTGRIEVYVRPFQGSGAEAPVSTDGGAQVRWNPDGRELFYIATDGRLMRVPVAGVSSDGRTIELGAPAALFPTNIGAVPSTFRQQYIVSPDGASFVLHSAPPRSTGLPLIVILNWTPP